MKATSTFQVLYGIILITSLNHAEEFKCLKTYAGLCEQVENYPESDVLSALQDAGLVPRNPIPRHRSIPSRTEYPGIPACSSASNTIRPQLGMTADHKQVLVANVPDIFEQRTDIEYCLKPNGTCEGIERYVENKYTTACLQRYVEVNMRTYENRKLTLTRILVPASCSCLLSSIYNDNTKNLI